MASIEARLHDDLKAAMKAGDKVRLCTIRLARSQLQTAKMEAGERWPDEAALEALAAAPKDLGKVMSVLMPKVKGRTDGKLINTRVGEKLGAS